jgi:hypothetical protein
VGIGAVDARIKMLYALHHSFNSPPTNHMAWMEIPRSLPDRIQKQRRLAVITTVSVVVVHRTTRRALAPCLPRPPLALRAATQVTRVQPH